MSLEDCVSMSLKTRHFLWGVRVFCADKYKIQKKNTACKKPSFEYKITFQRSPAALTSLRTMYETFCCRRLCFYFLHKWLHRCKG